MIGFLNEYFPGHETIKYQMVIRNIAPISPAPQQEQGGTKVSAKMMEQVCKRNHQTDNTEGHGVFPRRTGTIKTDGDLLVAPELNAAY